MESHMWTSENETMENGFSAIAGIDEAGRGPLAGPVVSAAVILPDSFAVPEITDSKKLTPKKRSKLYSKIYEFSVAVGIGVIDPIEIDRINILQASLRSMAIAVQGLTPQPDFLLIDGKFQIPSSIPQKPIIKGDSLSISIAAASIVAKVTRDKIMYKYHEEYPQYEFDRHKGYPTRAHKEAIRRFGCCPIHRKTFKGVKEFV